MQTHNRPSGAASNAAREPGAGTDGASRSERARRILEQIRNEQPDEARLMPAADKRQRDVAKRLDKLQEGGGWHLFAAGQAHSIETGKAAGTAKRRADARNGSHPVAAGGQALRTGAARGVRRRHAASGREPGAAAAAERLRGPRGSRPDQAAPNSLTTTPPATARQWADSAGPAAEPTHVGMNRSSPARRSCATADPRRSGDPGSRGG